MSKSETDYRAVVETLYEHTRNGDWASAEQLLTEDFFVTEPGTLPFGGTYRGRGALRQLVGIVFGTLDVVGLDIHDITVGHEHAVSLLDMSLAGEPPLQVSIAEVFRFRDGKVCEIRPCYFDTGPVTEYAARRASR